jgi:hypothetical protein
MIYGVFLCGGLVAPFVIGLGYVWVDTFSPQHVAYSILNEIPVSAIMAAAMMGAYLLMDRKAPPRPSVILILILMMAGWVTYTSETVAVAPEFGWAKWDWAIKTIGFAAFMPFLFRSRVQIEAFLQVYIFSAAIQIVPYGITRDRRRHGGPDRALVAPPYRDPAAHQAGELHVFRLGGGCGQREHRHIRAHWAGCHRDRCHRIVAAVPQQGSLCDIRRYRGRHGCLRRDPARFGMAGTHVHPDPLP